MSAFSSPPEQTKKRTAVRDEPLCALYLIFDKIKSQGLGYITIENDSSTIEIQGNDTIYDSYLNISLINYEKYEKKNRLHKMLDELIEQDMNFVNTLEEYFNTLQRGDGKSEEN